MENEKVINKQLETVGESSISAQELQLKPKEVLSLIVSHKQEQKGGIVENWEREREREILDEYEMEKWIKEEAWKRNRKFIKNLSSFSTFGTGFSEINEKFYNEKKQEWEKNEKGKSIEELGEEERKQILLKMKWEERHLYLGSSSTLTSNTFEDLSSSSDPFFKYFARIKTWSKEEEAKINRLFQEEITKENKETKAIIRQVESKHGGNEEYQKRIADLAQLAILKVEEREKKYMESENAYQKKILDLEKREEERKEREEEAKEKAEKTKELEKKLLETQNQLHSPIKVDLEALKEKHRKLEAEAKNDKELVIALKEKTDDYKLAIEQLKEEREREEREKSRFLQLYLISKKLENQLEREKGNLQIEFNSQGRQLKDWEEAYLKWDTEKKEQNQKIYNLTKEGQSKDTEIRAKDRTINNLTTEKNQLKTAKEQAEQARDKAIQKGRLTALGNVVQGALDYIPGLPKAWKSLGKSSIQAGSAALIIYDLPNWSYELIIILFGLICWFGARSIYYRIVNRKERNKLQELQGELLEMRSKYLVLKEERKESGENFNANSEKSAKSKRSKK